MRLWPTTNMLARETLAETDWKGDGRARRHPGRDRKPLPAPRHRPLPLGGPVRPRAVDEGDAAESWSFNHFCRGPQGCPGVGLAMLVGRGVLSTLLSEREVEAASHHLHPAEPLPHMLDFFALRFGLTAR